MPEQQPHGRAQTIKQAKAAFKARDPTAVSSAERRQLERGAVLLERAARLKELEQRRKVQAKKREQHPQQVKPVLFGTQVKLDRFGHKSSQLHLGAFLKPNPPQPVSAKSQDEPWDEEDVDDDALLDIAAKAAVQHKPNSNATTTMTAAKTTTPKSINPPVSEDLSDWDDFLESSTQLARELATEKPAQPSMPLQTDHSKQQRPRIPSFNSPDFDFDLSEEDLEELESGFAKPLLRLPPPLPRSASEPTMTSNLLSKAKAKAKAKPTTTPARSMFDRKSEPPLPLSPGALTTEDSTLMPPPPPRPQPKSKAMPPPPPHRLPAPSTKQRATTRVTKSKHAPPQTPTINMPYGISLADLESLADEEIQLTQLDGD